MFCGAKLKWCTARMLCQWGVPLDLEMLWRCHALPIGDSFVMAHMKLASAATWGWLVSGASRGRYCGVIYKYAWLLLVAMVHIALAQSRLSEASHASKVPKVGCNGLASQWSAGSITNIIMSNEYKMIALLVKVSPSWQILIQQNCDSGGTAKSLIAYIHPNCSCGPKPNIMAPYKAL